MRIGEFEESVAKELAARRAAMTAELPRLGAKLTEATAGTLPATRLADAVRISAEARAAHFGTAQPEFPLAPFPSPSVLAAALRAVLDAPGPEAAGKAVEQLGRLVRQLAGALPAMGTASPALPGGMSSNTPSAVAAALVRELLAGTNRPAAAAALLRQLLAELPATPPSTTPGVPPPSLMERATAAILLAVRQGDVPGQQLAQRPGEFPAALLSHLAQAASAPKPAAKRTARRRRRVEDHDLETDDDLAEAPYRSRPERK